MVNFKKLRDLSFKMNKTHKTNKRIMICLCYAIELRYKIKFRGRPSGALVDSWLGTSALSSRTWFRIPHGGQ